MQPGESKPQITPSDQPPAFSSQIEATPASPASSGPLEASWTASEYIDHQRSFGWYILLGLASVGLAILIYALTEDKVSAAVIVLVGIIFGIGASRRPRTLDYRLDHAGLRIGEKFYSYAEFKSFSISDDGAVDSILLIPMKRFLPGISVYYPPDQENQILTVLSTYLPHEERSADVVDRLARKLRF